MSAAASMSNATVLAGPQPACIPPAEQVLVARLCAGEQAAFEELVREHAPRLLAVCRRILPCEEDARDAVQDTFLLAYRALDRFQGEARLSTWLHRIAVNSSLMKRRARRGHGEVSLDVAGSALDRASARAWREGHADEEASDRCDAASRARALHAAIDRLPERHRRVLSLRDLQELDTRATAEALGLSPGAVKVRLHRARRALRELLEAPAPPASDVKPGTDCVSASTDCSPWCASRSWVRAAPGSAAPT